MIQPTPFEIERGTLLAGHRLLGFPSGSFPEKIRFRVGGKTIRRRAFPFSAQEATPLLGLLEERNREHYLNAIIREPKNPQEFPGHHFLHTFNMRSLYKEWGFREGDALLLTPCEKSCYDLAYLPAAKLPGEKARREWVALFDQAAQVVSEEDPLDADHFVRECFDHSPALAEAVPAELPGLILESPCFMTWLRENREPEEEEDSIEPLLRELGLSINTVTLYAMGLDAFFRRKPTVEALVERIFKGREIRYPHKEAERHFTGVLTILIKNIASSYNIFQDQQTGPLRQAALDTGDELVAWFRRLDKNQVSLDELPPAVVEELLQLSEQTDEIIEATLIPGDLAPGELKGMTRELSLIREKQRELIEAVFIPGEF